MPGALLGAASCGRCGFSQPGADHCSRCHTRWTPAADVALTRTDIGVLAGVVRAGVGRRQLAHLVDALPPIGLAAVAALGVLGVVGDGSTAGWVVAWVSLAVLLIAVQAATVIVRGRSLGRLVLGLRTVDDLTGTPIGWRRRFGSLGRGRRRLVTADLRHGLDPLEVRPGILELGSQSASLLGPAAEASADAGTSADRVRRTVWIALDNGERYEIHGSLLLGRNPVDPDGSGRALLAWPDLSRRLGRTHALLEWSGTVLWVTDLGAATGTTVLSPAGDRLPLAPRVRTAVSVGATIEFGGRSLRVAGGG